MLGGAAASSAEPLAFERPFTPIDPYDEVAAMGRGMNVLGADPVWTDPSQARFQARHFKLIHDAGFSTVRIALHGLRHMDADGRLDPTWLATLDTLVTAALQNDLHVSLDLHYHNECDADVPACTEKIKAFWSQLAPRYQNAPNAVMFELLNEPHGKLDAKTWNAMLPDVLAIVRTTNPARNVVVSPAGWGSIDQLNNLALPPDDQHVVVTVHYYWPMTFTHQGAHWVSSTANLSGIRWGTTEERAKVATDFDNVKSWSDAHHRPIFLGEFGAYDRGGADIESRIRYDYTVARQAEAHGFAWAYWQFDSDFVAYDMTADTWVTPILYALMPPMDARSARNDLTVGTRRPALK
jgi:endoglucanase